MLENHWRNLYYGYRPLSVGRVSSCFRKQGRLPVKNYWVPVEELDDFYSPVIGCIKVIESCSGEDYREENNRGVTD
jgi:hypothetical protein